MSIGHSMHVASRCLLVAHCGLSMSIGCTLWPVDVYWLHAGVCGYLLSDMLSVLVTEPLLECSFFAGIFTHRNIIQAKTNKEAVIYLKYFINETTI